MNLTRRNILKALSIGAAVSVSGASIAKDPKFISWDEMQSAVKLMDAQAVPIPDKESINAVLDVWSPGVNYTVGEKQLITGSDGNRYQVVAENGMYTMSRLSNV